MHGDIRREEGRVLVTGGAGFIGSNLAEALVREGFYVRIVDNLSTGKLENLEDIKEQVEFLEGDIRDIEMAMRAAEGMDFVFHQAALPSVQRSIEDPISSAKVNIEGTLNMLMAARDKGVGRLIYASSSSVYGDSPALPKEEGMPANPKSPYALSKFAGERYCQIFYEIYGLETVCLRYFNVFGPRQDHRSMYAAVIPIFVKNVLDDKPIIIYGDGEQTRDFTYVDNAVEANLLAMKSRGVAGKVFNVACGRQVSVLQLALLIMEITGRRCEIRHAEGRKGEVRHSLADITLAEKHLGYRPVVDVESGLMRYIGWFKEKGLRK